MKRIFLFSTLFILLGLVPAQTAARARTIKGPKKQKVDIRVTEHSVDIDFDDESYE